jgi:hypothetical protein
MLPPERHSHLAASLVQNFSIVVAVVAARVRLMIDLPRLSQTCCVRRSACACSRSYVPVFEPGSQREVTEDDLRQHRSKSTSMMRQMDVDGDGLISREVRPLPSLHQALLAVDLRQHCSKITCLMQHMAIDDDGLISHDVRLLCCLLFMLRPLPRVAGVPRDSDRLQGHGRAGELRHAPHARRRHGARAGIAAPHAGRRCGARAGMPAHRVAALRVERAGRELALALLRGRGACAHGWLRTCSVTHAVLGIRIAQSAVASRQGCAAAPSRGIAAGRVQRGAHADSRQ